jgi:hypothetical protein
MCAHTNSRLEKSQNWQSNLKKTEKQQGGLERQPFLGCHGNARVYSVADVKD